MPQLIDVSRRTQSSLGDRFRQVRRLREHMAERRRRTDLFLLVLWIFELLDVDRRSGDGTGRGRAIRQIAVEREMDNRVAVKRDGFNGQSAATQTQKAEQTPGAPRVMPFEDRDGVLRHRRVRHGDQERPARFVVDRLHELLADRIEPGGVPNFRPQEDDFVLLTAFLQSGGEQAVGAVAESGPLRHGAGRLIDVGRSQQQGTHRRPPRQPAAAIAPRSHQPNHAAARLRRRRHPPEAVLAITIGGVEVRDADGTRFRPGGPVVHRAVPEVNGEPGVAAARPPLPGAEAKELDVAHLLVA